jgi:hypothetical protein
MKRILVYTQRNSLPNKFEGTETEALAWLERGKREHWFGQPAVYESRFNEETQEFEQVEIEAAEPFEIVIEDITQEINSAKQARKEQRDNLKAAVKTVKEANPADMNSIAKLRPVILALIQMVDWQKIECEIAQEE